MSTATTMSLQLPDLPSLCSVFELRANRHCRVVSQASEQWLLENDVLLSSMAWSAAKPGLLAAACHPSADTAQLRFITDFLSLLLYHREQPLVDSRATSDASDVVNDASYPFMLLSDRLSRMAYQHPKWYMQFSKSRRRYLEALRQLFGSARGAEVPNLETYIEQMRDASGFRMALDMVQYAGDVNVPDALAGDDALFVKLHDHACDIAAWCQGIVSCAKGIPLKHEANIVRILMTERNVTLESAVSTAGALVKQSVDAFVVTEESVLLVPEFAADHEVRRYIRGLREWIAGFVNWLYETKLFLGEKGNEVRAFGWVFVPVESRQEQGD